jgi:predicted alpha-1,2-mannosidase
MRGTGATALVVLLALALVAPVATASGLADHVSLFAGTEPGHDTFGGGHNFPGATVPFGMVQWSPDTTPADKNGEGYDYRDNHVSGFSLTHLSGAGCGLYGDFPFLPTTEPITSSPADPGSAALDGKFQPGFSHGEESARPGYYSMRLNPVRGAGIDAELTATTRTGMGRFTFPHNPHASVLINAGGSAQPDDFAGVEINPDGDEISGVASSGLFCGQRPRYKVYFSAVFDRPFAAYGTWTRKVLESGSTAASDSQQPEANPQETAQTGAYATFDTTGNRIVLVRVGISFVSVANARANLAAESHGAGFGSVAFDAQRRWNQALGKIRVSGGSARDTGTFYTALYHAFVAPRTFNDVDGEYIGMDGRVHSADGHTQYADISGWDTYRTQVQLLSILMPDRASDLVRSMLADADQSGCLPRWPYANGQSMTMVGDPADAIIASTAAFGARAFDRGAALAAMVRGATQPCESPNGSFVERQGLSQYEALGFLPYDIDVEARNANSIYGDPDNVWASAGTTLEYATDDFSIAQFAARSQRDRSVYHQFMQRSANWHNLFNPQSGEIEPRYADGSFIPGYDNLGGAGFAEGNSIQYTWMIPHDPAGLFAAMGGRAKAADKLDYFLRRLNGSLGATHTSHALLGNEPNLNVPWLYDWTQRPFRTQQAVRRAILGLYDTSPSGYPGNDDLGTLSSWYVFGALGLYPEVPGVDVLAIGSPLFPRATVSLAHRRKLRIDASAFALSKPRKTKKGKRLPRHRIPLALPRTPYIRGMSFNGHAYGQPWTTFCALAGGATLDYQLGAHPNRDWGDSKAALPPSFGPGRAMPKSACTP